MTEINSNYLAQAGGAHRSPVKSPIKGAANIKSIGSAFIFCKIDTKNLKISDIEEDVVRLKDSNGNLVEIDLGIGAITIKDSSGKHRIILEATPDNLKSIIPYLENASKLEPHEAYFLKREDISYELPLLRKKASSIRPKDSDLLELKDFFKNNFDAYLDPQNTVFISLRTRDKKPTLVLIIYPDTGKIKMRSEKIENKKSSYSETPQRQITKEELKIIEAGVRKQIKADYNALGKEIIKNFINRIKSEIK